MLGQWVGNIIGANEGVCLLNIEKTKESFLRGVAYFFDSDTFKPNLAIEFIKKFEDEIDKDLQSFSCKSNVVEPIDPMSSLVTTWDKVRDIYKDIEIPKELELSFEIINGNLNLYISTDIGTKLAGTFKHQKLVEESDLPSTQMTWIDFKKYISVKHKEGFLYRGQNQPWKLQTSFHRTNRCELMYYYNADIPQLQRALSSKINHVLTKSSPEELGAFLNLAQHHGYPTPLLDWSQSPYIAAFFAFKGITETQSKKNPNKKVRIFIFDSYKWINNVEQFSNFLACVPHITLLNLLAIENNRMVPQQATTTITNIADIESFIKEIEKSQNMEFLKVIDIPWSERNKIVKELTLMGITAGSMFPGLDGTCEELKEKMFSM